MDEHTVIVIVIAALLICSTATSGCSTSVLSYYVGNNAANPSGKGSPGKWINLINYELINIKYKFLYLIFISGK